MRAGGERGRPRAGGKASWGGAAEGAATIYRELPCDCRTNSYINEGGSLYSQDTVKVSACWRTECAVCMLQIARSQVFTRSF